MRASLLLLFCIAALAGHAQFRNDNIAFRTVYINDLCDSLRRNPDRLILDVRSPGEYSDTSSFANLNIGRLKGAVNIDVNEVKNRLAEIRAYQHKPVFVICSHSQRSRVCSKLLADSGFTHVINVNGAMTEFNLIKNSEVPCVKELYETSNKFQLLSPTETGRLLASGKPLFILDVRSDSAFRGISRDPVVNAQGMIRGSVNIPLSTLQSSLSQVPKGKPVLVVSDFGRDGSLAAKMLTDNGFDDVRVLFNGLNEWISASSNAVPERSRFWEQHNRFGLINAIEFDAMMRHSSPLILDVRSADEFNNKITDRTWRNRGHIRNAINIPAAVLESRISELGNDKDRAVVVYTFNTDPETIRAANELASKGFSHVYVLTGGIWNLRAKGANTKGLTRLMDWVVDIPAENL
jgi:rhodanese-related sulfurtransferase